MQATVLFIHMMNKWFDVMNVKDLHEGQHKCNNNLKPYSDLNDPHLSWQEEDFLKYLDNWKENL